MGSGQAPAAGACGALPSGQGSGAVPERAGATASRLLLSGLLDCGNCGGTYAIGVGDRYGCVGHHRRGSCTNNRRIRRDELERRALAGIADRLVSADKVEAAVAAYASHINRENRDRRIQANTDRRGLARIEGAVAGIMAAIEDGLYKPAMKARMAELERERVEVTARLAAAPQGNPDIHPGIAEIYKRKVAALTETLKDPETRLDASSDVRSLVGKIVLHPGEKRGEVHATLHGSLMGILDFANDNPQSEARVITSVAPCSRGRHYLQPCGLIRYFSPVRFALYACTVSTFSASASEISWL